jgi:uncharacterized ferritin-like protein (DUF455 family)
VSSSPPPAERAPDAEPQLLEDWARRYLLSRSLPEKRDPGPPPARCRDELGGGPGEPIDLRPGRPPELRVTLDKPKSASLGALRNVEARARLVHKFWHHELQAAELMCWAILRFPETPADFRRGLGRIARDEVRHMGLYEAHLTRLGYALGDFPVRDWFWERAATCESALSFVAFIGLGLEGANLEHTERFGGWFRLLGDEFGAEVQDRVGREEVAHVRFAARWFRTWTGDVDFETWRSALPPPITPLLLRGKTLRLDLRRKAELPEAFLDALGRWQPS